MNEPEKTHLIQKAGQKLKITSQSKGEVNGKA